MSDHLPECPSNHVRDTIADFVCQCAILRACEQRVRNDEHRALITHGAKTNLAGYSEGFADGAQAARDAVAALDRCPECSIDDALAAIDALRGEA